MMPCVLAALLISAIPSVAGLGKIRSNIRLLQSDDATFIAEYQDETLLRLDYNGLNPSFPFTSSLEFLLELMEADEEVPPFSSEEMSALAVDVFSPDEDGVVDIVAALMNGTERFSASSPVMKVLHEELSNKKEYETFEEFMSKVNDVAQNSGQESELLLASIATTLIETLRGMEFDTGDVRNGNKREKWRKVLIDGAIGTLIGYLLGGIVGAILFGLISATLSKLKPGTYTFDDDHYDYYFC